MKCHFVVKCFARLLAALMPLLFAGLAQAQVFDPKPVPVPKPTTKILLEIDIDIEKKLDFRVVYPYRARPCQLCTLADERELGKGCERALSQGINICEGLVDATVDDLAQIMLIRSRKNPYCITIASAVVGGTDVVTQLCLCTGETTCPAPMWIQ